MKSSIVLYLNCIHLKSAFCPSRLHKSRMDVFKKWNEPRKCETRVDPILSSNPQYASHSKSNAAQPYRHFRYRNLRSNLDSCTFRAAQLLISFERIDSTEGDTKYVWASTFAIQYNSIPAILPSVVPTSGSQLCLSATSHDALSERISYQFIIVSIAVQKREKLKRSSVKIRIENNVVGGPP